MGRNKLVHVSLHDYIEAVLERIDIEKIQNRSSTFLLIREMICYNIYLCFLQRLDAQLRGFMQVNRRIM